MLPRMRCHLKFGIRVRGAWGWKGAGRGFSVSWVVPQQHLDFALRRASCSLECTGWGEQYQTPALKLNWAKPCKF